MTEPLFRGLVFRLVCVPVLALLGFLLTLGFELRQIASFRTVGAHATTVVLQVEELQKCMIDEETGIRGYLAAKNSIFLQPYSEASRRFQRELSVLENSVSTDRVLSAKVAIIYTDYNRFNKINQLLLASKLTEATEDNLLGQQKQAMDVLRSELAQLIQEQIEIRELNRADVTRIIGRLPMIGIGGGAFIAILLLWYGNALFRKITAAFVRQLRETEVQRDYFATTLQSIGDAVIVCDSAGKVTLMNPAAVEATRWTNDKAQGQPLEDVFRIINEETRQSVESPVQKVFRVGGVVGLANHTLLLRPDGTEIPIDDSGAPIFDSHGMIVGVVLVFRDISERKQNEEELRRSNASKLRLAAIIDSADDSILSKDLNGIVDSWNKGACRLFGYSADEMVGQSIFRLVPEDLHQEEKEIMRKIRAGERIEHYETVRTKKNGETFEVSITISPIRDMSGRITGASNVARDISGRKRMERLLIQSEKLAATGRMAATIAHEINNPLESLVNLIFLARHDIPESSDAFQYLRTAEAELERISHIARQTLGFYRDNGAMVEVRLSDLLENVTSVYASKLDSAGIMVEKRFHEEPKVIVRKGEILQIFSNIIANAIDAMRNGGLLHLAIRQAFLSNEAGVEVSIRDNGMGIRPEHLNRIFEPFFTTKGSIGTGIGLWVTKQLVENRGGHISVVSAQDEGTRGTLVTIFVPFALPSSSNEAVQSQ